MFIAIALMLIRKPDLVPYGILGAVILDVDVLFRPLSDSFPQLYIFTHGGFTHSLAGAVITSTVLFAVAVTIPGPGFLRERISLSFEAGSLAAVLAGAISHVFLDFLAYPGIPLLYPLTDIKFTLGILSGPSVVLMLASIGYIILMRFGKAAIDRPQAYVCIFVIVMLACGGLKFYVDATTDGKTIPTIDPSRWLVIKEDQDSYSLEWYRLFEGASDLNVFQKYAGVSEDELGKYEAMPEVKRLRYNSYITTVEKNGSSIIYSDPLREQGYLWYPPDYKQYHIPDVA
nr:metal-dependent hydrolase [Methanocella sp. CWC-04]